MTTDACARNFRLFLMRCCLLSWVLFKAGFTLLDRDRELSLDKIRDIIFTGELALGQAQFLAFDRMAENKLIPLREALFASFTQPEMWKMVTAISRSLKLILPALKRYDLLTNPVTIVFLAILHINNKLCKHKI